MVSSAQTRPDRPAATLHLPRFLGRTINRPHRLTVIATVAIVGALGVFFISRMAVEGEVYPGVRTMNASIGGLRERDARQRINDSAAQLLQSPVTLSYGDKVWTPALADLGAQFDVDAAVNEAMAYGRNHHVISGLFRPIGLSLGSVNLTAPVTFDSGKLDAVLLGFAAEAGIAPVDAGISVDGDQPIVTADRPGQVFDASAVASTIGRHIGSGRTLSVKLVTIPRDAAITAATLQNNQQQILAALSSPIVFIDGAQKWTLATKDLVKMVQFVPSGNDGSIGLTLKNESIRAVAQQLTKEASQAPIEPGQQQGERVVRLAPAQPGKTVNVDELTAEISAAFVSGNHDIPVPFDQVPANESTDAYLASLGATTLLAEGTSDFVGSEPGRATNVQVAASLINNVLIPPGGTFSFNYSIGEINVTPGYVAAGASENGISGTAVGGGVCQVTTTIYRAVLKAGLPITEWWPHAYRNIYYEAGSWSPGFDASVQQPDEDPFGGSDLLFSNPTDRWILIRSRIDNETQLIVDIYGSQTGYNVQIDNPVISNVVSAERLPAQESIDPSLSANTVSLVQPARDGMTVTVKRRVYGSDGVLISDDSFVSNYEPQGPSYRVSPDKAGSTTSESA